MSDIVQNPDVKKYCNFYNNGMTWIIEKCNGWIETVPSNVW